jgi:hypothetical protein
MRTVLLLLLAADAVFVAVHLVHALSPFLNDGLFSIERDRSYAEIFQYVKTYWVVLLLAALAWRTRESVYVAWMLLYAYLLFDDAFRIHEEGGAAMAARLGYVGALGLRPEDLGELTVSAVIGVVFLALILITYRRGGRDARNASSDLALLVGVLAFFGVFVDMLRIVVEPAYAELLLAIVEDGGEMVAMSFTCWYALGLLVRRGQVPAALWQRFSRR